MAQIRPSEWIVRVKQAHPLVHNITNLVVMQISANALLAAGASPVMAHAVDEVPDMVRIANAVVLNIGTLDPGWVGSMRVAAESARLEGVPVVLDPVGAGATAYRTQVAHELLMLAHPAVLRGNAGEIGVLARGAGRVRGVDADGATVAEEDARRLATRSGAVVVATGPVDLVTDGRRTAHIANGHPWLETVTGTGCSLSAIVAAFVATATRGGDVDERMDATIAALLYFEVAAERAAVQARGPGSFAVALLDELATMPPDAVDAAAQVTWQV